MVDHIDPRLSGCKHPKHDILRQGHIIMAFLFDMHGLIEKKDNGTKEFINFFIEIISLRHILLEFITAFFKFLSLFKLINLK